MKTGTVSQVFRKAPKWGSKYSNQERIVENTVGTKRRSSFPRRRVLTDVGIQWYSQISPPTFKKLYMTDKTVFSYSFFTTRRFRWRTGSPRQWAHALRGNPVHSQFVLRTYWWDYSRNQKKIVIPAKETFQKFRNEEFLTLFIHVSTPPVIPAQAGIQEHSQIDYRTMKTR